MNKPLLVVLFNEAWCHLPESLPSCPIPYRLSKDPRDACRADLVVFHIPTFGGALPRDKPKGQLWVAWSMESAANYPELDAPEFLRWFDLRMTYQRDADVWVPYLDAGRLDDMRTVPRPKTEGAAAVYFASNPRAHSNRDGYVRQLMRYLKVDCFGKCLQNRRLPGKDRGRESKLGTISRYRFTLAFENSVCPDYVTEKFYDPLVAGSVPVYLGAPNVADFAPARNSYIPVSDFHSPEELAGFLKHLACDEQAYGQYATWRSQPFARAFAALARTQREHPLSRLLHLCRRRRDTSPREARTRKTRQPRVPRGRVKPE